MAEYINHRDIYTLQDLLDAISEGVFDTGKAPCAVIFDKPMRLTIFERTLTDGSTVHDIDVTEPPVWGPDDHMSHENGWTP